MTAETVCIFNRNSKCIFKGGICDQECDNSNWEGNNRSHENLLEECLEGGNRKLTFPRKAVSQGHCPKDDGPGGQAAAPNGTSPELGRWENDLTDYQ